MAGRPDWTKKGTHAWRSVVGHFHRPDYFSVASFVCRDRDLDGTSMCLASNCIVAAWIPSSAGGIWYAIALDKPSEHAWVSSTELRLIQNGLPKHDSLARTGATLSWRLIANTRYLC